MATPADDPGSSPLSWRIRLCRGLWYVMRKLWTVIIVGTSIGTLANLFTVTTNTPLTKLYVFYWILLYPFPLLSVAGVLLILTIISWVGSRTRSPAVVPFSSPDFSLAAWRNRLLLLERVQAIWIDGFLEQSLPHRIRIDLQLQEEPDALDDSLQLVMQELRKPPHLLPVGTGIVQVFDEAQEELLILGKPGSGKTTLLFELTRTLLQRAKENGLLPIPVVFHLSSWNGDHSSLAEWMSKELQSNKYRIPQPIAMRWIKNNEILPLLDGLDEVPEKVRAECVEAINTYQQQRRIYGRCPLVICSRSQKDREPVSKLVLNRAISICPLSDTQIDTYLAQSQGHSEVLQDALQKDPELRNLVRQPLMLRIFTLTYKDSTVVELPTQVLQEQLQQTILADYVRCMCTRRKRLPIWMDRHFESWLITIAKHLHQQSQIIFSIEDLQLDWLPKNQQILYRWSTALGIGLAFGLITGLSVAQAVMLVAGPKVGLIAGLLVGLYSGLDVMLAFWVLPKIQTTAVLTWPWKNARFKLRSNQVAGPLGTLWAGLITGLIVSLFVGLNAGLVAGLVIGIGRGLGSSLIYGFLSDQLVEQDHLIPNEGTWHSVKNSLVCGLAAGLGIGLVTGICVSLVAGSGAGFVVGLDVGLVAGMAAALVSGLRHFFQHFALRFWLWCNNILPWDLVTFLNEATDRLLLQRVGGSYLFVHRLLQEYFVSLISPLPQEQMSRAVTLNRLTQLFVAQEKYAQNDPRYAQLVHYWHIQIGFQGPFRAFFRRLFGSEAMRYDLQGKYEQAEPLYLWALLINEKIFGPEHPKIAINLQDLATFYAKQGKYAEAEPLLQRALAISEQQLGPEHPDTAASLNKLGLLYREQGKYTQAEPLLQRALHILEQQLGPEHSDVATALNYLAIVYYEQSKDEEAEKLYQRAFAIYEQQLGPDSSDVAIVLNNLALLYQKQGKYAEAEPLLQRALAISEQQLGPEHPDTAASLNDLALLYLDQGKYAEAEPLLQRALRILEQQLGPDHPNVAYLLSNLASLYTHWGKYAEAEPLFQRALSIFEQMRNQEHLLVDYPLNGLANLYKEQAKYAEAEPLYQSALAIREHRLGVEHPKTADTLYDFAICYQSQGNLQGAESLYQRALVIREQSFGSKHPKTVDIRTRYTMLLREMKRLPFWRQIGMSRQRRRKSER